MSLKRVGGALLVVVALSACSTPVAPAPVAPAPVDPAPVDPAVMDKAGWLSGARALLTDPAATDDGLLGIGVTLCGQMPLSQAMAEVYASSKYPGAPVSADGWFALAAIADRTLCPGGIMLPEGP